MMGTNLESLFRFGLYDFVVKCLTSVLLGLFPLVGTNLESLFRFGLYDFVVKRLTSVFTRFVPVGGHKWTRTTDLTLIRRAL